MKDREHHRQQAEHYLYLAEQGDANRQINATIAAAHAALAGPVPEETLERRWTLDEARDLLVARAEPDEKAVEDDARARIPDRNVGWEEGARMIAAGAVVVDSHVVRSFLSSALLEIDRLREAFDAKQRNSGPFKIDGDVAQADI